MARWPPIIWLMVSVGSLLILVGYNGEEYNPEALILAILLIVGATGLSFYVAFARQRDRPRATGVEWLIPATVVFYVLTAAAALLAGEGYAIAALAAGLIPLTAATLIVATARAKTAADGGSRGQTTAGDHTDPFPGVGMDDATPVGDTPEHSHAERVAEPDRRFEHRGRSRSRAP